MRIESKDFVNGRVSEVREHWTGQQALKCETVDYRIHGPFIITVLMRAPRQVSRLFIQINKQIYK